MNLMKDFVVRKNSVIQQRNVRIFVTTHQKDLYARVHRTCSSNQMVWYVVLSMLAMTGERARRCANKWANNTSVDVEMDFLCNMMNLHAEAIIQIRHM